ncbi:hypothetical protein GOP47_0018081 [Adiantum capillus-veneris]|nr:hypothetical protein GOP47_0018081 [Adiantum capillus-veneris]
MLGHRTKQGDIVGDYIWQTYKEVYDTVVAVGSAMRTSGLDPKARCGVYGSNCPEWLIAMEACNGHSIYCVPLYDSLGPDAVEYIVGHAEVSLAFVYVAKMSAILECLPKCADYLKTIVSFGELTEEQRKEAQGFNVIAYSWTEFVNLGMNNPVDLIPPKKEDISTIMYTSGTTGEPKGVLLTHENITDVIDGVDRLLASLGEKMTDKDVYFSFLPLAHIFDRLIEEYSVRSGAAIGFWQGDVKLVLEDVGALKPTIFAGVPRVYDRVYAGALQKVSASGFLKKKIFDLGYRYKLGRMLRGIRQENASPFFDNLAFSKIKQGLGGHVRILFSGAAPLAMHVEEFLRVTTCALAVQGYGLTETCAASFVSVPDVMSMMGTVGVPLPNIEVCLESVPELGYDALAEPARGEVCIRGKSVFISYHKREDLTKEVVADGWFHTGDIGEWQKDGALKLIDRKKNIFKLSQGEYVAVENLENIYSISPVVESIWIYGNSFESSLIAIVAPSQVVLEDWARANALEGDFQQLCNNEKAKEHVLSELRAIAKTKKLKGFEIIKAVHLEPQPFDLERDLITPTYKKKRPQLLKYYKEVVDRLYQTIKS